MDNTKKENKGLTILVVVLLLACIGMGGYIGYDKIFNKDTKETKEVTEVKETKDTSKNTTTEKTEDIFKDNTVKPLYFETNEKYSKYLLNLVPVSDTEGYFTIRYVGIYDTGSESPVKTGNYNIKDGKLVLKVNSDDVNAGGRSGDFYKDLEMNFTDDAESSNYKNYTTTYNEKQLTIGNRTFYNIK